MRFLVNYSRSFTNVYSTGQQETLKDILITNIAKILKKKHHVFKIQSVKEYAIMWHTTLRCGVTIKPQFDLSQISILIQFELL